MTLRPAALTKLAKRIARDELREERRVARVWQQIERRELRAQKLANAFYEGKPCPYGHTTRYVKCNRCVACNHEQQRDRYKFKVKPARDEERTV